MALIGKKTESIPTGLALVMGNENPLSDPRMRMFVRSAVTNGDYGAVQDAHTLAESLAPPGVGTVDLVARRGGEPGTKWRSGPRAVRQVHPRRRRYRALGYRPGIRPPEAARP